MTCDESMELLQRRLDGGIPRDRATLDQHLGACPECRALHAALGPLEEGLRQFTAPTPPAHFLDAVVGNVLADRRTRRARRVRWTAVAVAASLLLVFGLTNTSVLRNARDYVAGLTQPQKTPEPVQPAPKQEAPVEPTAPSPIDLVTRSGSAVTSLPRRVAEESLVSRWSMPKDVLPQLPDVGSEPQEPALEVATASLSEAKHGMSVTWQTVESPMRRATSVWSQLTPSFHKE